MCQIITSKYKDIPVVTAFINGKLEYLSIVRKSELNEIYLGRVDHVVKNLDAAFVKYGEDLMGYLPMKNVSKASVVNRNLTDDKLKCGDEVIVQVETEAIKQKKCRLTSKISIAGSYCVITLDKYSICF